MVLALLLLASSLRYPQSSYQPNTGYLLYDALRAAPTSVFMNRARTFGYKMEEHFVTTQDGYTLKLFRILPSRRKSHSCKKSPPVYLFHGLLESSDFWVFTGPEKALAYLLADNGYDVWLGNARGNIYSRNHTKLPVNSYKFWNFSFHEIGIYDNPAVIDYILSSTNQEQLHYVGHSQGSTTFFITTSLLPQYNQKIKTMHGLAPVTYFSNQISPFFSFAANYSRVFTDLAINYGFSELLPNSWIFRLLANNLCNPMQTEATICSGILSLFGGQSPTNGVNLEQLKEVYEIFPAGASIFQLLHFAQGVQGGGFRFFDYGPKRNMQKYGTPIPPDYPLKNVTASPIFLYVSKGDLIAQPKDVERLSNVLKRKPTYVQVEDKLFGHFDFLLGQNSKKLVYDRILSEIERTETGNCDRLLT